MRRPDRVGGPGRPGSHPAIRLAGAGLVVLAHVGVGLLAAWVAGGPLQRQSGPPATRGEPPARVWLWPDHAEAAVRPAPSVQGPAAPKALDAGRPDRRATASARPAAHAARMAVVVAPAAPGLAEAITLQATAPGSGAEPAGVVAAALPARAASQPPGVPLQLVLPRRYWREAAAPAAEAAQQGRPAAPPLEQRLAAALGTDTRLRETAQGERRRFVQGRQCVDTRPAREAGLNPFNQSAQATPRLAEPC